MLNTISIISILLIIECYGQQYDKLDLNRNMTQLIESRNFKSETHWIRTSDGYILQVFRLINPLLEKRTGSLKPIILQHGFLTTSEEFLFTRRGYLGKSGRYIEEGRIVTDCVNNKKFGKSLGFVLSACGYDVWLSNIRGNKYGQLHTHMNASDHRFWKFTLDEHSQIDLPAIIDYIGTRTRNQRIGYIGYSMGTTIMFQLLSAQTAYASVIDPFIAIAPVVYLSKIPKLLSLFKSLYPVFRSIPRPLFNDIVKEFALNLFSENQTTGQDLDEKEMELHTIDQSSTLVLSHFLQIIANERFARFDWGWFENYIRYGRAKPVQYSLADITSNRIVLIQSKNRDIFSDSEDLLRLKSELNVKPLMDYWIPSNNWTHSDYLFNERTDKYLVSVIMNLLAHA